MGQPFHKVRVEIMFEINYPACHAGLFWSTPRQARGLFRRQPKEFTDPERQVKILVLSEKRVLPALF